MMIRELFKKQYKTFSFEFFPPKNMRSAVAFGRSLEHLKDLDPSFVSVTYGAGGSTQERTFELVDYIQNKVGLRTMCHYTCVNATRDKVKNDLQELYEKNIRNLMLLRGDAPQGQQEFDEQPGDLKHGTDMIKLAAEENRFCIGGAGYPEGHQEANSKEEDIEYLKMKEDLGADFIATQMFFDNNYYFDYMNKVRERGINIRIIPGIIPITNYKNIKKFSDMCGSNIPEHIMERLEPYQDDLDKTYQIGVDIAIEQCRGLLEAGAPGIHFYTLNKYQPIKDIYDSLPKELLDVYKPAPEPEPMLEPELE